MLGGKSNWSNTHSGTLKDKVVEDQAEMGSQKRSFCILSSGMKFSVSENLWE